MPAAQPLSCKPIMDLAVVLPLAVLLFAQAFVSMLLLAPRAVSRFPAAVLATSRGPAAQAVLYTLAVAVGAMTLSSLVQLISVLNTLRSTQFGDR